MEAQSYGIPVIATNIGGVHEIISEETGFLLPVDFRAEDLAEKINIFLNMSPAKATEYSHHCFNNWDKNFNASSNYQDFIKKVNRIFETLIK
jgi:colanic acid/amylovoran biosynthesis glycosyltransferase